VGLIARVLEEMGISTVCIVMRREVAQNVKPPRTLFVRFPLGAPCGPANEAETHRAVIRQALDVLATAQEPGTIVDSPLQWKRENSGM
jgi:D-proline reductase (dithiol) PrdB